MPLTYTKKFVEQAKQAVENPDLGSPKDDLTLTDEQSRKADKRKHIYYEGFSGVTSSDAAAYPSLTFKNDF